MRGGNIMTGVKIIAVVILLVSGVIVFDLQHSAYAVPCDAIVGKWAWFTGGNLYINPDGTISAKEYGVLGKWECANPSRGVFTISWTYGGYVDTVTLSADGRSLSGTNQHNYKVTASRVEIGKGPDTGRSSGSDGTKSLNQISPLDLKVTSVKTFESGPDVPAKEKRVYSGKFDRAKSRYVSYELNYVLTPSKNRRSVTLEERWYRPDGSLLSENSSNLALEPEWSSAYFTLGYGWKDPGRWLPGVYRTDFFIGGAKIASGSFEIYEVPSAKTHYSKGREYLNKSKYDEAIAEFTKAVELDPKYQIVYYYLGVVYSDKKDYDNAIANLSKAVELDPEDDFAWYDRADVYLKKGEYALAISDYTKVLELDPDDDDTLYARAEAYIKNGQYDEAEKDANRLISILSNDASAYSLRGRAKYGKGKYEWALNDFNKAIEKSPKFAEAYNNRGNARNKLGQQGKALNDFLKARDLGFEVDKSQLDELLKLRSEGKIPSWEVAEARLHFDAGKEYYRGVGPKDKAIAEFTMAIELDPVYAAAYLYRGMAYYNKGQLENSAADFAKFAELDPKDARLYGTRASFYRKQDKYGEAVNDYSKAIKYDPKNTENYYWRGQIYMKTGKHEAAILDYTKLIEISPKDTGAYDSRAFAYMKTGQYEKAVSDYTEIIEFSTNKGEAYYNRASAYRAMGDKAKFLQDLKKAEELGYKPKK